MVAFKKSVDHRTEMNSITSEILEIKNITEIFQKVEENQQIVSFLKTEEKQTLLRRLYNIYPKKKSNDKIKKDGSRSRRSSNKITIDKYDPKCLKVSVLDIFKEGLLISPKFKTCFLSAIKEMQPKVIMLSSDSVKNITEFYEIHKISCPKVKKENFCDVEDSNCVITKDETCKTEF